MEINRQEVYQPLGEEEKKAGLGSGRSLSRNHPPTPGKPTYSRLTFEAVSTWNKGKGQPSVAETVHLDS